MITGSLASGPTGQKEDRLEVWTPIGGEERLKIFRVSGVKPRPVGLRSPRKKRWNYFLRFFLLVRNGS